MSDSKVYLEYKGALGDTVCLTAFFPELSERFSAKITVISSWPGVFKNNPYIDTIIEQSDIVLMLVSHRQFLRIDPATLQSKVVIDTVGVWS